MIIDERIFYLLVIFQLKHFFCDFVWQNDYMLKKFQAKGWVLPLSAHAGTHAWYTFTIAFVFLGKPHYLGFSLLMGVLDFCLHFGMDRLKASPSLMGRFKMLSSREFPTATKEEKAHNKFFWYSIGIDQFFHHMTHYAIIYMILRMAA